MFDVNTQLQVRQKSGFVPRPNLGCSDNIVLALLALSWWRRTPAQLWHQQSPLIDCAPNNCACEPPEPPSQLPSIFHHTGSQPTRQLPSASYLTPSFIPNNHISSYYCIPVLQTLHRYRFDDCWPNMGPQRYAAVSPYDIDSGHISERLLTSTQVNQQDHEDDDNYDSPVTPTSRTHQEIPHSPPPSFRSRNSSPSSRRLLNQDPLHSENEDDRNRDMADAFDDSDNEDESDDRQRLMRNNTSRSVSSQNESAPPRPLAAPPAIERRITSIPSFAPSTTTRTAPKPASDGVFANLSAKPTPGGEPTDDKPPTYAEAAADATPAYWETTILAPGLGTDEVYVNGLPVGSVFSFIWNGMISMSFLFPGFLLTYLLHTTHAAKNGSLAGLGLTLVQYGFYMRGGSNDGSANPGQFTGTPPDPNSHDFDPNNPTGDNSGGGSGSHSGFTSGDMISYGLMIIGWFILIRAVSGFLRARREEQVILQSPARGLNVPVVAEGEGERAV